MFSKLTPLAKVILAALVVVIIIGLLIFINSKTGLKDILIPQKDKTESLKEGPDGEPLVKISVCTWGGYAGGEYYNNGFKANEDSRFFKEQDILVDFILQDDYTAGLESWKSGEVDLIWSTIDIFPILSESLSEYEPVALFQADWSRGGDAIVVRRGINNVNDLRGKSIAVAIMTPSNTFLIWLLNSSNLTYKDVEIKEVANAIDAAQLFKDGTVDAAVVWSPDDADCVSKVTGSKVLQSTKNATNIIADVFIAKKKWVENNKEVVEKLLKGWFIGTAEINSSEVNKKKAAKILSDGLSQPEDFCLQAINNVRLASYGDNINFYNINGSYSGVKGEDIYSQMTVEYAKLNYVKKALPWRQVILPNVIKSLNLTGDIHLAESSTKFDPVTQELKEKESFSTKSITIVFASGSATLDENAKLIIDKQFVPIAKSFGNTRIRVEGNTDNTGNDRINQQLSEKRAQSVIDYLINEHGFDENRFIVVGNGSKNPVESNNTDYGRSKNRRTDFELIN